MWRRPSRAPSEGRGWTPGIFLLTPRFRRVVSPSHAGIAQLVERNLAKVEVASSSLVSRSLDPPRSADLGGFFTWGGPWSSGGRERCQRPNARAMRRWSAARSSARETVTSRGARRTLSHRPLWLSGGSASGARITNAGADLRSRGAASSLPPIDVRLRALRLSTPRAVHICAALHRARSPGLCRARGRVERPGDRRGRELFVAGGVLHGGLRARAVRWSPR